MPDHSVNREELEDDLDGIAERIEQFLRDYAAFQDDESRATLPSIYSKINSASDMVREAMFLL